MDEVLSEHLRLIAKFPFTLRSCSKISSVQILILQMS